MTEPTITWEPEYIGLKVATARISRLMDARIIKDAFQASSILAGLFALTKEHALDVLIQYRRPE